MDKITLKASNALGMQYLQAISVNHVVINENEINSLISIGCPLSSLSQFSRKLKSIFKIKIPEPGNSVIAGDYRLSWAAQGQWYLESGETFVKGFDKYVIKNFGGNFAITDQSDGWAKFSIYGLNVLRALEKCTMLNIYKMPENTFTRCSLEHIGVYLLCEEYNKKFVIYAPRSFAESLYHSLIEAAKSI